MSYVHPSDVVRVLILSLEDISQAIHAVCEASSVMLSLPDVSRQGDPMGIPFLSLAYFFG